MRESLIIALVFLATGLFGQEPRRASLVLLGDIYSGETYVNKGPGYQPTTKNLRVSFAKIAPYLKNADHIVGNLECAVPGTATVPISPDKKLVHRADLRLLQLLRDHRLTNVSLANNHAMDYGRVGLINSLEQLQVSGFTTFGAGKNAARAARHLTLTCGTNDEKQTVILVAGFEYVKSYHSNFDVYAAEQKSGINLWTPSRAAEQIRSLRALYPDAVIIAFPHWGDNYTWRTKEQQQLARSLIGSGATAIIGHGAHMIQEIEYYKGRLIVYSLGNFFFLTPGRYIKKRMPPISLVARLDLTPSAKSISLYPINTNNLSVDYQPRPATEGEVKRVRMYLEKRCHDAMSLAEFGTDKMGYYFKLPVTSRPK